MHSEEEKVQKTWVRGETWSTGHTDTSTITAQELLKA